ncbi:MAG: UDP-2,3-diacylglucosamine diphosphatase [Thermodesulfobacteriota bacterium]
MARSGKDWIFVSDAHFTGRDPESMEVFARFLDLQKNQIDHLVILGDLFEFFFGFRDFFPNEKASAFKDYLPIFHQLQRLYREGIRIKYFEGNHDFFLHSFFSEQFGMEIEVYPDGCDEKLEGKRAFIAHGDLSNPRQWTYRAFRKILKNSLTYRLIHLAGPRVSRRVARTLSDMSYQKYHNGQHVPPPPFRAFAHRKFLEGFEIVILGHSHFPEEVEEWVDGRRCLYYNVGDWMVHRSFLRFVPPDHFRLERYEGA